MSELKCTHSCSDCSRLGCRSASEEQYPPFCLTTNVDKALLEETPQRSGTGSDCPHLRVH